MMGGEVAGLEGRGRQRGQPGFTCCNLSFVPTACTPVDHVLRPLLTPAAPLSLALISLQVLAEELEHTSATLAAMEASHVQLGKTRDEYHGQVGRGSGALVSSGSRWATADMVHLEASRHLHCCDACKRLFDRAGLLSELLLIFLTATCLTCPGMCSTAT